MKQIILFLVLVLSTYGRDVEKLDEYTGGFHSSKFDSWVLETVFDSQNVPTYKFINSTNSWRLNNSKKNEYIYKGNNSKAGNLPITDVTYYLYKNKNYFFEPNSSYHSGANMEILNRFYFYRFTGKALKIVSLDNPLLAVDTHSKLVFAFGIPMYFGKFGNPTFWGEFSLYAPEKFFFYKYDPIGYVKEDGNVVLFEWFKIKQAGGGTTSSNYYPNISSNAKVAQVGASGYSPYLFW